ncbi:unnamed protein product [Porites lobata]|uniref:Porimin n=1 Tax=Porites lobata TaxID=104759 RepID=A0ABN8NYQ5_9CNID|nr:unnamed protein product [Porites lobata]
MTLSPPQTVSRWPHFPVLEFLHGKQATNLQTEILRPDHRMARLTSLQWEMRVLGCILLVYFSTGTVSSESSIVPVIITSPATADTKSTSKIASTTVSPTTTSSTTPTSTTSTPPPKASIVPTAARISSGRKFDGASFIGGIILGMVLTAIFILAYKWWQKRNKSYHSL